MVSLTDGTDAQVEKAKKSMDPVATPYFEKHKDDNSAVVFMYAKDDDLAGRLQNFTKISSPFPVLAIVDMEGQKKYICDKSGDDLNEGVVRQFLEDYLANKLTAKAIKE